MNHILKCHEIVKADIVRGHNCYLYDTNDMKYVDFESGVWCTILGHNHSRINETIKKQIDQVMHLHYRYTNHLAEDASVDLLESVGFTDGKCIFLSSGSEAVEFGVQIAKVITGKKLFLTLSESYLAAYGSAGRRDIKEWVHINLNSCLTCKDKSECDRSCDKIKDIQFDEIGAFVFEPGCASGNVKFPPEKLVDFIVKEVKRNNGVIIVDEVTTGFGRTGKWYGFNHYALQPDIVAVGKGLGNGYPVSAVAMKHDVAHELEKRNFHYVQSHQNDPLGCAVAKEVISIIKEQKLVDRSFTLGDTFLSQLHQIEKHYKFVKEIRGRGLMISMEFAKVHDNFTTAFIYQEMLKKGFLIGYNPSSRTIRFLPPLTIEKKEITNLVEALDQVLGNINKDWIKHNST